MSNIPRLTPQAIKILGTFMAEPRKELSGADVATSTSLLSGTLYPLLIRFEKAGWLTARWEDGEAPELGRPKRKFYKITAAGQMAAGSVGHSTEGRFAWA
jgi:DNA-binding PadR family transcriptional regulator